MCENGMDLAMLDPVRYGSTIGALFARDTHSSCWCIAVAVIIQVEVLSSCQLTCNYAFVDISAAKD